MMTSEFKIGDLQDRKEIGSGCSSKVYKGKLSLNGKTAVKIIKNLDQTKDHLIQFLKEIRVHQNSNCNYLIRYISSDIDENTAYIFMEYAKFGNLQFFINMDKDFYKKGFPKYLKYEFAIMISKGLLYLHKKKILHRDLNSNNILISKNLETKICDYGFSRIPSQTIETIGAPAKSTEYRVDSEDNTIKIDLYSLFIIFIEIFTGSSDKNNLNQIEDKELREFIEELLNLHNTLKKKDLNDHPIFNLNNIIEKLIIFQKNSEKIKNKNKNLLINFLIKLKKIKNDNIKKDKHIGNYYFKGKVIQKNIEEALEYYKKSNCSEKISLINLLLQQKDLNETFLKNDFNPKLNTISLYISKKKFKKFDKELYNNFLNSELIKQIADYYYEKNNFIYSLFYYKHLIENDEINYKIGNCYFNLNIFEKSKSYFKKSNFSDTILKLCQINLKNDNLKEAKNMVKGSKFEYEGYKLIGEYFKDKSEFKKALKYFRKASTKIEDCFNDVGDIYLYKDEYKKAIKNYKKALNTPNGNKNMGYMYFQGLGIEKNLKTAKSYFKKAISLKNEDSLVLMGKLYIELNNPLKAKNYFLKHSDKILIEKKIKKYNL